MDKQFFMTYQIEGVCDFEWFDTEDELKEKAKHIKSIGGQIFDAVKIESCKQLEV